MYNKNARDELSSETAYRTVQTFVNDLRKYKNQYNKKKCRSLTSNSCQV